MGTKAAVIHSQKRIWADEEAVGATAYKGCEGSINLVAIARVRTWDLQPECVSSRVDSFHGSLGNLNISRIYEYANASGLWQQLTQESRLFAVTSELKKLMPVALPPGRDRLATRPCLTGSSPILNTIGIVVVVAFAASAAGVLSSVTTTFT